MFALLLMKSMRSRMPSYLPHSITKLQFTPFNRFIVPISWISGSILYMMINKNKIQCSDTQDKELKEQVQKFQSRRDDMKVETLVQNKKSIFSVIWSIFCHIARFVQLLAIFSPVILLFPLRKFGFMKNIWLDMFVTAVERAGVVWIKAFQYMSHRRDIIGPEMADKFVHLRENAPQHSFKITKQNFKKSYGKNITDVFDQFDQLPIASGSVSQVYKGIYKGKKVAVKVRHPGVEKHIQRDINILFTVSRFLSVFSKRFTLPVTEVSMKKTLIDQIDFNNEKENLIIFNHLFEGSTQVKFPIPFIQDTTSSFLIQSFVEGVPITYYEKNPHPLNSVIARMGAMAFFDMLMKYNFIHADCHGGNIMVEMREKTESIFSKMKEFFDEKYSKIEEYFTLFSLKSQILKKLFKECKRQEQEVRQILKKSNKKVNLTLIDVGMVIRLEQKDRINFISFIKSVLHGQGQKCAEQIYSLSLFNGKKILSGNYEKYMGELRSLFGVLNGQPVENLKGVELFVGMLDIIRQNNMKLEGQFATLLTNMLVLEAIAKDLNPQINILKCAIPYFKYVDDPIAIKTV